MGFFKKITKKFTNTIVGGVLGFVTGGPVGAIVGAAAGYGQDKAQRNQEKAQQAQLAAAQRIADAQNPANLVTAVTPNASTENAQVSEENMASEERRKYSFSKTLMNRRGKLGNSGGSSDTRDTLG